MRFKRFIDGGLGLMEILEIPAQRGPQIVMINPLSDPTPVDEYGINIGTDPGYVSVDFRQLDFIIGGLLLAGATCKAQRCQYRELYFHAILSWKQESI